MRRLPILVLAAGVGAAGIAAWLFPRAFPIVALEQTLTRDVALARGDSFFRAHALVDSVGASRTAVQFRRNDSLRTFIELAAGGHDSLNALVRGDDVTPYLWSVRAFTPGNVREARVDFAPDGRAVAFERRLAEGDTLPQVSPDSGRRLAEQVLGGWFGERLDRWTLVSTSYETRKTSGRVDRTYTFERTDRRIGGAPIRADVVIAGNAPSELRPYVDIPESFSRRYAEMRAWNVALSLLATLGVLAIAIAGVVALARQARRRQVRWREPLVAGAVIGAFMLAAGLNQLPLNWFSYDTAMSPTTFQVLQILAAISLGVATALLVGFTLAAAEVATRQAFPGHLDWWKLWRLRGTKEVAASVGGGYAVAAIAFAYVATFYLVTRTLFGWWVPSELLDDPNQIATPMPWVSGIAISLQAAVWEEALFRALPLSLLSLWIGQRAGRRWWMAAGVVVTALVFGFAHANYESWPPYSRGVEIFLDAAFWAVLFIAFGLLVTVVAHFVYDAVLFGIFAAQGDAVEYCVTAAIILLALVAPALVVLWRRLRQGAWLPAPDDARFAAWVPGQAVEAAAPPTLVRTRTFGSRTRRLALAAAAVGLVIAVGRPRSPTLGSEYTVGRERVFEVADSVLRLREVDPSAWRRLSTVGRDTLDAWPRFVREHDLEAQARHLATTYAPATWWVARYVRTTGTAAERAEEWRIRVWPDGRLLDVRHILPDSAPRDSVGPERVRQIAKQALAVAGIDTLVLRETNVEEAARPARRDVTVTYTDTSVKLPAGAAARAWVQVAGDEPLVARRGIELPETFVREDRARLTNRMMVAGGGVLALVALVITGAVLVKRQRPVLVDDGHLTRRQTVLALAALTVLMVLSSVNALPSQLYGYDTAQPWSTFVGITVMGMMLTLVVALILYGLWLGLAAMRRRAGIPMLEGNPSRAAAIETLIVGLGLGGIFYAASGAAAIAARGGLPRTPGTVLDQLVPWVAGVVDVPANALTAIVVIGIPVLVIAALSRRWSVRVALAAVMLALLTGVAWSAEPSGDPDPALAGLALATMVASLAALVAWGSHSAWSWIVAALAYFALDGLRDAVYAPVWQAQLAGGLVAAVSALLMWSVVRRVESSPARSGSDSSQLPAVSS